MEHFWDLLFQLVKHGTNTLHVAFIFLFREMNLFSIVVGLARERDYSKLKHFYFQ